MKNRTDIVNDKLSIGRIVRVSDGSGVTSYSYNATYNYDNITYGGRCVTETRTLTVPFNGITEYETVSLYDSFSRLHRQRYETGTQSVYAYDDGGSLSQVEYRSDDNKAYRVGFTYDQYGRRKRVSRMAPGSAGAVTTTVYSYNTMHRLLTLRTNGSDGSAISARRYTYDNVGNITQLRDIVTGMVHNYSYDGYYQLTGGSGQASDNSGNAYYGITVDYDRMHRPVAKNQQMGQTGMLFPGDVTVGYGLNYNYSATHKFRLESVYRHHFRSEADVMVEGDVIHDVCRFSYDSNGNMTGVVTDRPAADGHTERRIAERKLLWDEENRLRAVDDNGFISCYFYDHTGRRTIKLTGGGRHLYVNGSADTDSTDTKNCTIYPGPNTVFSFSDGAYRQGRLSRHIYAGNERILTAVSLRKPVLTSASGTSRRPFEAQKDTLQSLVKQIYADCGVPFNGIDNTAPSSGPVIDAESVYFYHPDHLGSTTLLTDATGRPTQRVEYAPFGELFLDRRDGTTWHTPYLFNAKELDEETGLYYYGARYYDPHLSLWISPDPLERKYPFFSTYSYTMNNPVRFIDPDGRELRYPSDPRSSGFHESLAKVRKYLGDSYNDYVKILKKSPYVFNVIENSKFETYAKEVVIDGKKTAIIDIHIDVTSSLRTANGDTISTAIGILHEFGHAVEAARNIHEFIKNNEIKDSQYGTMEERRNITEVEHPAAKRLEEPIRNNHGETHLIPNNGDVEKHTIVKQEEK